MFPITMHHVCTIKWLGYQFT